MRRHGSYAHVPSRRRPKATIEVGPRPPAEFFANWLLQTLRHGLPARRRGGPARALAVRSVRAWMVPKVLLQLFPRGKSTDLDALRAEIEREWSELVVRSARLGARSGPLSIVALRRSASLSVFVFDESPVPLLIAKVPGDVGRLESEAEALELAAEAGVAPRSLGRLGRAFLQEGVVGAPLAVAPVSPASAVSLEWSAAHMAIAAAFVRLGVATATAARPEELVDPVSRALESGLFSQRTAKAMLDSWEEIREIPASVLRHADASPQNCLVRGSEFGGIVDWENARRRGAPGFDLWNLMLAVIEHGVGLRRWNEDRVVDAFRAAWLGSEFVARARSAARDACLAGGVPPACLDAYERVFFARRLGQRLARPDAWAVGPRGVARMVEIVCGR